MHIKMFAISAKITVWSISNLTVYSNPVLPLHGLMLLLLIVNFHFAGGALLACAPQ